MKAAIDIGTNTVLLLIAEVNDGNINVIREEQRIPRLGKGVDNTKLLHRDSMERVLQSLRDFKEIIESEYPEVEEVIVTATSAVRDAENRDTFIKKVKDETGYEVRLLSGDEEAQYTFLGALSVLELDANHNAFVLDIGGGSTELALGNVEGLEQYHSFDMGSVRFKERFLLHNPPYQEEIFECNDEIKYLFGKTKFKPAKNVTAIGVAGTATSLAAIDIQLDEYENERLNGHIIDREKLSKSIEIFSLHTYDQLLELSPKLLKGREDIFLTGLLILEGFMKFYDIPEIKVSTGGIRHGAMLLAEKD
ncbi:MAG: Ppx/GppA family phosphatase [Balneolaceae bacterium]|nr:Ppx/GppA family phosphatase [Balneolaceae bacterium]MBO6546360.1 Ppx/GppA family phosphatase [Balneolaceae bacterium]MBO6648719.1 Ppx/GppA family phosphatase [Balneolaceae bacterium]